MWGEGKETASSLRVHMSEYCLDWEDRGHVPSALAKRLASIGSDAADKNCQANLVHLIAGQCNFSQYLSRCDGDIDTVLLPSRLLRMLHRNNHETIVKHLGADVHELRSFWTGLFSRPEGMELKRDNSFLRDKAIADLMTVVPLCIHEDAGPYAKQRSANGISFSGLLGRGTDLGNTVSYVFAPHI